MAYELNELERQVIAHKVGRNPLKTHMPLGLGEIPAGSLQPAVDQQIKPATVIKACGCKRIKKK